MFSPTALLVMTHNVTGLKYFCKTAQLDWLKYYKGSGKYWKRHLAKHGKDISVEVIGIYEDENECRKVALEFSQKNDVAKSDSWANLILENGIDGAPIGEGHPMYGKPSPCIGHKRPQVGKKGKDNPMYGKPSPMRGIAKPKGKDSPLFGRARPEGGGKRPNPVIRIDNEGGEVYFDSVAAAAKSLNVSRSCIHTVCTGRNKTGAGYKWKYAEIKE